MWLDFIINKRNPIPNFQNPSKRFQNTTIVLRWNHLFGIQIAHGSFAKMTESSAIPDQNFRNEIP